MDFAEGIKIFCAVLPRLRVCYDSAQNTRTCVFSFWFAVFELHIPLNQNNPRQSSIIASVIIVMCL